MAKKRTASRRSTPASDAPQGFWNTLLWLIVLFFILAGLIIILAALIGQIFWFSFAEQLTLGGLVVLISFTVANALQRHWPLALGWLLLVAALWLASNRPAAWAWILAALLAAGGLFLLTQKFVERWWEQRR